MAEPSNFCCMLGTGHDSLWQMQPSPVIPECASATTPNSGSAAIQVQNSQWCVSPVLPTLPCVTRQFLSSLLCCAVSTVTPAACWEESPRVPCGAAQCHQHSNSCCVMALRSFMRPSRLAISADSSSVLRDF